jgi:hypothetical protein
MPREAQPGSGLLGPVREELAAPGFTLRPGPKGVAVGQAAQEAAVSPSPAQGTSSRPRVPAEGGINQEAPLGIQAERVVVPVPGK